MRAVLVAFAALAVTAGASAADYVSLPSPRAALSPAPPLGGGATASVEIVRHRVRSHTSVDVALDPNGTAAAVHATQSLDVRVTGDYFFTIGAPLLDVEAGPGSEAAPGLRATSIVWSGFNPGHRKLVARATLDPAAVAAALPLRVEVAGGRTTLVNATGITTASFTADALTAPLRRYFAQVRRAIARDAAPPSGSAYVTSKPRPVNVTVVSPLHVVGSVGGHPVDVKLTGRHTVPAAGTIRLTVETAVPASLATPRGSGRALLTQAVELSLTLARAHQYDSFLGNPDPTGADTTVYTYRTAAPSIAPPVAAAPAKGRDWTVAWLAGTAVLLAGGLVAWTRS
jgi:hypothetical protein